MGGSEDLMDWSEEPDPLDLVADSNPLGWVTTLSDVQPEAAFRNFGLVDLPKKKAKTMPVR